MATITINEQDVASADAYLSTYLREKIPEADFSQGSALRDFVIKAIAHIFAYLRAEVQVTRDHQSLLALQRLPPSVDVDEAVDAILSNLFISRRGAAKARVAATLHFTNRVDVVITTATRFFRDGQAFLLDQASNLFIPGAALRQVFLDNTGSAEYVTTVSLIAAIAGKEGNVSPGRFSGADRFSANFSYAENTDYGLGGEGTETTSALITRAPTALSVRNLTNVRSVDAVLMDAFPELTRIFTAGFGDPEMTRDRSAEGVTAIDMHTGGYMDVYVALPTVTVTENLTVGAAFSRADGVINVFRDTSKNFGALGVVSGDVLKIHSGLPDSPREYIIQAVSGGFLTVALRASFAEEVAGLPYSVGALSPLYDDKVSVSLPSVGETVNYVRQSNSVFLAGRPKGIIRKLEVSTDSGSTWGELERVNLTAVSAGQYAVVNETPTLFQSNVAVERVYLPAGYDDEMVRVTYDTLAGFDVISAKVVDQFERNVCANNLVRGFTPVYVAVSGTYALKTGEKPVDDAELKQALSVFISTWDSSSPLDVSAITRFLRDTFPTINRFYDPVTILFTVYAPDGQLYEFQTTDVVTVFPDGQSSASLQGTGAHPLRDEALLSGLRFPDSATAFNAALLALRSIFRNLGVTERSVRLFPDAAGSTITPYID